MREAANSRDTMPQRRPAEGITNEAWAGAAIRGAIISQAAVIIPAQRLSQIQGESFAGAAGPEVASAASLSTAIFFIAGAFFCAAYSSGVTPDTIGTLTQGRSAMAATRAADNSSQTYPPVTGT